MWRRSYSMPTRKKSAPVEMPCAIITMMAPCTLATVPPQMPSITKPRWLTDEYAISFLRSGCTIDTSAAYTMPITASVTNTAATGSLSANAGKNGIANRRKP